MATKFEVIKNWMENIADNNDLISIVRQVNSWNGSLEEYNFYDMDELDELFCGVKLTDFLSKLAPNFNHGDDGFRDSYQGLESCSMQDVVDEIKDNIEEVAEAIADTMEEDDIWIPSSLEELLEEE